MKLTNDMDLYESGIMHINKGLHLGNYALSELQDGEKDDTSMSLGCYMIAQSIELLLKGICYLHGCVPPAHHIMKHTARIALSCIEKSPELYPIIEDVSDMCNNAFSYVIQTWQKYGRYENIVTDITYIDKAEIIYNSIRRFILSYKLNEEKPFESV